MQTHPFQLIRFIDPSCNFPIAIGGNISRNRQTISLVYEIAGNHTQLQLPAIAQQPMRSDDLWKRTCFECFFKQPESTAYYELNVCPDGHWNLYRFSDYRKGMAEASTIRSLPVHTYTHGAKFTLCCNIPLDTLVLPDVPLQVGISCVLAHTTGKNSYWALCHPGRQPDFHHPAGYLLHI